MANVPLQIIYETRPVTVAVWDEVVIFAAREAITVEGLEAHRAVASRLAAELSTCWLSVIGERTRLPGPDVVRAAAEGMSSGQAKCCACVIPGHGLWATAFRGVVTAIREGAPAMPFATVGSIHEATAWLSPAMSRDLRWQVQLTTIAGTLVYGTPSWKRASALARYMNEEPSDKDG